MPFTFTQVITQRSFPNGVDEPRETGPSIRITVTAEEGFPVSPDAVSTELGHFVMRLLAPGQSASVRSRVDPWPLPDGWHGQAPPSGARETMADFNEAERIGAWFQRPDVRRFIDSDGKVFAQYEEEEGHLCGAAVAFGLMGMAEAIGRRGPWCPSKREYWASDLDGKLYYNCFCARCEFRYLKALEAGVDEGTDYELCGDCRY